MRPIKFRGKRLDNGKWIIGYYLEMELCDGCGRCSYIKADGYEPIKVDPNTIGQYTGLKDKKWTMIFEGDILLLSDGKSHSEDVVVEHGLYGWTFYNPQTATFYSDGSHTYLAVEHCRFMFGTGVVIGNIHDNPDLLK